jgi:hypothetical protein
MKKNKMGGACDTCGGEEKCVLLGRKPIGRLRRKLEDNINVDLKEM